MRRMERPAQSWIDSSALETDGERVDMCPECQRNVPPIAADAVQNPHSSMQNLHSPLSWFKAGGCFKSGQPCLDLEQPSRACGFGFGLYVVRVLRSWSVSCGGGKSVYIVYTVLSFLKGLGFWVVSHSQKSGTSFGRGI